MNVSERSAGPNHLTFPTTSTLGFLVLFLWLATVGGALLVIWGNLTGILAALLGFGFAVLYRRPRFQLYVSSLGSSRGYATRVFVANVFLIAMLGFLAYQYASDPFVSYNTKDLQAMIHTSIGAVIAIGALAANVVAHRRDRQRITHA